MRNNIGLICLTFPHCVLSNVSSNHLHEYFDLKGPYKVLTYIRKSLYTLQANPEKSWDFIFKNIGILINNLQGPVHYKECAGRNSENLWAGQKS